ncbi:hypothetical protein EDD85DRAFT_845548, partial [Armillaria nabsnona]
YCSHWTGRGCTWGFALFLVSTFFVFASKRCTKSKHHSSLLLDISQDSRRYCRGRNCRQRRSQSAEEADRREFK